MDLSLAGEDCQHAVTDEALCTVTGCALGTDVCHWMFKTKVNMVQGQEDGPTLPRTMLSEVLILRQFICIYLHGADRAQVLKQLLSFGPHLGKENHITNLKCI